MKASSVAVECVEVYKVGGLNDGCVLGYLIHSGGAWDAWKIGSMSRYNTPMTRIAVGVT